MRERVTLFLSVEARDPVLAAMVHDLQTYAADDIAFGRRFAATVSTGSDGHVTADLTRLHDLEPESESSEAGSEVLSDPG